MRGNVAKCKVRREILLSAETNKAIKVGRLRRRNRVSKVRYGWTGAPVIVIIATTTAANTTTEKSFFCTDTTEIIYARDKIVFDRI